MSGLRHDKEILDSHATDPSTIEPGFHGHHLAGLQLIVDSGPQPRRLMDHQTDAMTDGMCDKIGKAALCEFVPAPRIDVATSAPRSHQLDCRLLNIAHRVVHRPDFGGAFPDEKRASHVGVVALDECSYVDHEGVPLSYHPRSRTVMRKRRILTARHDRLVAGSIRAGLAHLILEFVSNVPLGHGYGPFEQPWQQSKGLVRTRRREGNALQLSVVLDVSQTADQTIPSMQCRQGREWLELGHAEIVRVVADSRMRRNGSSNLVVHRGRRAHNTDIEIALRSAELLLGLERISTIHAQHAAVARHESDTCGTGEASEIRDVGERTNEECITVVFIEQHSKRAQSSADDDRREPTHGYRLSNAEIAATASG